MGYKNDDACIKKAYPDERLFVLMARDPAAAKVVLYWIVKSFDTQPTDKLREAFEAAIEMRDTCKTFQGLKEEALKKEQAARERDEFDRWKKRQEFGEKLVDAGLALRKPKKSNESAGIDYVDATQKAASIRDVQFTRNFANWLDAHDHDSKEALISSPHGFAKFLDEFIKSVPIHG
jgi:hypothetical protein